MYNPYMTQERDSGPVLRLKVPNWDKLKEEGTLVTFQKDFYQECPLVTARTPEDIEAFRQTQNMIISGENVPRPITSFAEAMFPAYLLGELARAGFETPTPIQAQGWPMALCGRDVVGIAQTGSGKTLAFLLPAIVHVNAQPVLSKGDGPVVLCLSPTRELAVQTLRECGKFGYSSKIQYTCVYGGAPKKEQVRALKNGVEIVVATPGRLIEFLNSGVTNLRRVTYLVLDEADRMLNMGFERQIRAILSQIRPDRQTLMWSATWPEEIQELAKDYTHDVIMVRVGSFNLAANRNVTQKVLIMGESDKKRKLCDQLELVMDGSRVLVFVQTKKTADSLTWALREDGWPARAIHGDKSQTERDWVLDDFRLGKAPLMIATDVASRGLDVKDISTVINFDFPGALEDYVHRVGRTARAGAKGTSITFFTSQNAKKAQGLIDILKETAQKIPPKLYKLAATEKAAAEKEAMVLGKRR